MSGVTGTGAADADPRLRAAFDAVAAEIEAMSDPYAAVEAAGKLIEAGAAFRGEAAILRARLVRRIWESADMSIAQLADALGVSKQRADQLLRRAGQPPPADPGDR